MKSEAENIARMNAAHPGASWHYVDHPAAGRVLVSVPHDEEEGDGLRSFRVLAVQFDPTHVEKIREYRVSCYAEAFGMAEREDAGRADWLYGVPYDCYDLARADGIAFNEADGLLL